MTAILLICTASYSAKAVVGSDPNSGGSGPRAPLTVIGIDAGEWTAINYLRQHGLLPTFDKYIREGASGLLESIHPMFTPIVWTTITTGKSPLEHGIRGFKLLNPDTGRKVPVNRTMRRTQAVWNMLSSRGLRSLVIAIYATWPAEPIRGVLISDYTWPLKNQKASEHFLENKAGLEMKDQTFPRHIYHKLKGLFIDKYAENNIFKRRFDVSVKDSPYALKHSYAKDLTYFKIFRKLRKASRYDFNMLYLQGPDLLSHQFFREFSLFVAGKLKPGTKAYKQANYVVQYYKFVDQLIAVYDKTIRRKDETVLIVSDHGFEDKKAPVLTKVSDDKFAKRRYWHRKHGLLLAHGPRVRKGARIAGATVFDITPTILAHFGLPVAADMDGRPLPDILGTPPSKKFSKVASYERPGNKVGPIRESPYDEAILDRLNDLGYIQ